MEGRGFAEEFISFSASASQRVKAEAESGRRNNADANLVGKR
jgi:hypothetical protein